MECDRIHDAIRALGPMAQMECRELTLPPAICGVYFLVLANEVVYIGQSVDIVARVRCHIAEGRRQFRRIAFVECRREDLNTVEKFMYEYFRPSQNGRYFQSQAGWPARDVSGGFSPTTDEQILAEAERRTRDLMRAQFLSVTADAIAAYMNCSATEVYHAIADCGAEPVIRDDGAWDFTTHDYSLIKAMVSRRRCLDAVTSSIKMTAAS